MIIHSYQNCSGEWVAWVETGINSSTVQWVRSMIIHKDKNTAIVKSLEKIGIKVTDSES